MSLPRADDAARSFLASVLPEAPGVSTRPMFGNLAAFANGYMFAGVFGDRVFVRLAAADRDELLAIPGAEPFAPMPDRPMADYALLPSAWREDADLAREWVSRSHDWVVSLPEKVKRKR
jgi:TfoX/Sxy family transcriptional regulator of competence genes